MEILGLEIERRDVWQHAVKAAALSLVALEPMSVGVAECKVAVLGSARVATITLLERSEWSIASHSLQLFDRARELKCL
jgi:hypothetical protein